MASSKGARIFGFLVLLVCVAVLAGGAWFFFGRQLFSQDDVASDDESDEVDVDAGAGTPAHKGHRPGKHHGKTGGKGAGGAHAVAAGPVGPGGKSYEAAIAGNHEEIAIGAAGGGPDLTDAQLAGPMRNAVFLSTCGTPQSTHVTVKVAIRGGRAAGVTVSTNPPDASIAGCIDRSVRALSWPVNAKMDSFVTTY